MSEQRPPAGEVSGIPWENEQSLGSLFQTIKVVLLETGEAFAAAPPRASFAPAFVFALILGIAGGLLGFLWRYAPTAGVRPEGVPEWMETLIQMGEPSLLHLALMPVTVVVGLFVHAGLVHLTLMVVGAAGSGFEATMRVVAYAQGAVALMSLVPFVGQFIGVVWMIAIHILGLRAIHRSGTWQAVVGTLAPPVVLGCCMVGLVMVGVAAGAAAGLGGLGL